MSFPSKLLLGFPDGYRENCNLLPQLIKEGKLEIIRSAWQFSRFLIRSILRECLPVIKSTNVEKLANKDVQPP